MAKCKNNIFLDSVVFVVPCAPVGRLCDREPVFKKFGRAQQIICFFFCFTNFFKSGNFKYITSSKTIFFGINKIYIQIVIFFDLGFQIQIVQRRVSVSDSDSLFLLSSLLSLDTLDIVSIKF